MELIKLHKGRPLDENQSCVNEDKIAKWVDGLKKQYPNKDDLVKHIISVKSAKGGFLGAIAGIGGAIAAPVSAVGEINKWIVQAEMAWAIAYVYGYRPSTMTNEFMNDMGILLGDESASKSAVKSAAGLAPKELTKSSLKTMGSQQADNLRSKLVDNLTKKLGSKVMKGTVTAFNVAQNAVDAAISTSDNKKFGEKAQKFYKN